MLRRGWDMTRELKSVRARSAVASLLVLAGACSTAAPKRAPFTDEKKAGTVKPDSLGSTLSGPLATHPVSLDQGALLEYLAQRLLDAPGALNNRVSAAAAIVVGTVERSELVENASVTSAPKHLVRIAQVRVQEWLKGPAGSSPTKLVWIDDGTIEGAHPGIDQGASGVIFIRPPTAKDLADAYPDARTPDASGGPSLWPDTTGQVASAIKWWTRVSALKPADQVHESEVVLKQPFGPEQQMAYAVLAHVGTAAHLALGSNLGKGKESPESLLRRAVLARAGDPGLAAQGLDPAQIDEPTLAWFGLTAVVNQGQRVSLLGPPPDAAIPDGAARSPMGSK